MKLLKKAIAIALCVMMCLSMASFTVNADAAEPIVTENILLNEDFSAYTNKEFLDTTGTASGSVAGHVWGDQSTWYINAYSRGDKLGSDGSSMLLNGGMMTVSYNNIGGSVSYYNPVITRKVDTSENAVGSAMVLPAEGELVVSAKVKVDANTTSADFSSNFILLGIAGDDALEAGSSATGVIGNTKLYHSLKLDASGNIIPANFAADGFSFARDKWHTVTFTYDLAQTGDKYACDITVATEGEAEAVTFTDVALNSAAGKLDSIYGITVGLGVNNATNKTGAGKVYYDDFNVKTVKVEQPEEPEQPEESEEELETYLNEDFYTYNNNELLNTGTTGNSWSAWASNNQTTWLVNADTRGDKTGSAGSSAKLNEGIMTVNYNNLGGNVSWYNPYVTRKVDTSVSGVGSAMALPAEGKLIVSAKVKVDANTTSADFSSKFILLGISGDDALEAGSNGTGIIGNTKLYHSLKLDASGNIIPANFTADGFSFARDKWHTVTFTYDLAQTSDKYACDITVATEGEAEAVTFTDVAINSTVGKLDSIYGLTVGLGVNNATNKTGAGKVYYDDFIVQHAKIANIAVNATGSFIEGTGYVVDVTAENQFSTSKNVWCVVAAYGENNALIDAKIADFGTMVAKTQDTKENVTLEKATSDNTQNIWIFVWDGYGTMVPYSKPVQIYPVVQK